MEEFENQPAIEAWLKCCCEHPNVTCLAYDVPEGILPSGLTGTVIDIKAERGRTGHSNDNVHAENTYLLESVARGNCILELHRIEEGRIVETKFLSLVFGVGRYFVALGEEDDSNHPKPPPWFQNFRKGLETTKRVVSYIKNNGRAAHIAARKISGQLLLCIGSRNCHMILRNEDDLSKYNHNRYDLARNIARTFFRTVLGSPEIPEAKKNELVEFMGKNHFTAINEILQRADQHIVNQNHVEDSELRFKCWTTADLASGFKPVPLCALPVDAGIERAREFGFKTTAYEVTKIENATAPEIEQLMLKVRKETGYEGKVFNFYDSENCKIGITEVPTTWYVLMRNNREQLTAFVSIICRKRKLSMPAKLELLSRQINQIKKWHNMSDYFTARWIVLSSEFAKWVVANKTRPEIIRRKFPRLFDDSLLQNPIQKQQYYQLLKDFAISIGTGDGEAVEANIYLENALN